MLTVSYSGGRTRQFSLRAEQKALVERWLRHDQKLRHKLEAICELNQPTVAGPGRGVNFSAPFCFIDTRQLPLLQDLLETHFAPLRKSVPLNLAFPTAASLTRATSVRFGYGGST